MSYKVVITDCQMIDNGIERTILAEVGADLVRASCKTAHDVIAVAEDADALLVQWAPITEEVIHRLRRCKIISRYGVGVDMIDVAAAEARGILVVANNDYCTAEVAQHALALLLACSRKLGPAMSAIRAGNWAKRAIMSPLRPLAEQTLGIIGLGRIGRQLAAWADPLVRRVIAYDPVFERKDWPPPPSTTLVGLEELLRQSDYVSLHCPLNSDTRGLFGLETFKKMTPTAYLINTSRGELVDEEALVTALQQNLIAGAALDVFHAEPLPMDHPLLGLPSVIATPHVGWYSENAFRLLQENTARAVANFLRGG